MDIIIPAGGIPSPNHPIYRYTQGTPKALLDVAGKPMIQWVLDAVGGAKSVGHVVVVELAARCLDLAGSTERLAKSMVLIGRPSSVHSLR